MIRKAGWFSGLWFGCAVFLAGQSGSYPIAGVVVNSGTGTPLKHVRVSVSPSGENGPEVAIVTREDGRFRFNVPEGKYRLIAERDNLPRQIFGLQSLATGFGTAIVTGQGQQADNLIFKLFSGAAITGKVTDESGEPVEDALLQLLRSSVVAGERRLITMGFQHSDDLGRYRFGRLPSGEYYLAATGVPWYANSLRVQIAGSANATDTLGSAYAPVFYPNANSPASAAPLRVSDGQELTADFSLSAVPGSDVFVTVADSSSSSDVSSITGELYLSVNGVKGMDAYQTVVTYMGGPTSIRGVPPGSYKLRLSGVKDGRRIGDFQTVNVAGGPVEVTLALKSLLRVEGKLQTDPSASLTNAHPVLVLRDVDSAQTFGAAVSPDGSFQFRAVEPGKYRLVMASRTGYIKRVLADGQEARDKTVEVSGDLGPHLNVLAGNDAGRLKGYVYSQGKVLPGALVVLAPENESGSLLDYHAFQTDSDGSFDFQNVPPGEYLLFASSQIELEYGNRSVIGPLLANAKHISITPRLSASADIQVH